jgi:hypothetical protein
VGPVLRARRGRAIAVELDHVFVLCDAGAPEAEALAALGLREGSPNTHPGQGTACRRFFFSNAYLELLWVSDADEAQREPARATRLFERWSRRRSGASPFGIVLRPGGSAFVFPSWSYRPPYLPQGLTIEIATGTPLEEPELFYIAFGRRPDAIGREMAAHALPVGEVTGVEVGSPGAAARSVSARSMEAAGVVSLCPADDHRLTLSFDGRRAGQVADLRPRLPLVLRW